MASSQRLLAVSSFVMLGVFATGEVFAADPPSPPGISKAVNVLAQNGVSPGPQGVGSAVSCPVLHQLGSERAACGSTSDPDSKDKPRGIKRALEVLANAPSFVSLQPVIDRIDAKHCPLPPLP